MRWTSNDATLEIARADSLFRVSKVWIFPSTPTALLALVVVSSLLCCGRRRNHNRHRYHRGTATSDLSPRRAFHISVTVSPRDLLVHILDGLARCGTATALPVVAKSNDLATTTTSMTTSMFAIATERRI